MFQFIMHPGVFKKAQEEIDRVVGNTRLPDFDDKPSLPYLDCVIREVFRHVARLYARSRFALTVF